MRRDHSIKIMKLNEKISFILIFTVFKLPNCLGYTKVNFENEKVAFCSKIKILGTYTQHLGHHANSGFILEDEFQMHSKQWQDDLVCTFKVSHPTGTDGVFAVIQSLSMRRNKTTGQCIDYIQFRAKDGTNSDQFCGKFLVSNMNGEPSTQDGIYYGNSFRTKHHKLHVYINIGKQPFREKNDKVEFKIVFTAYQNCSPDTILDLSYRPCKELSNFCIYNGFFNDGYVNCPLPGCVDEGSCSKFNVVQKPPSAGTKLLVGSISFLFILFVTFLISVWACKKHKVACFSEHFSNPDRSRQTRVMEMNEQAIAVSGDSQPSVPPIEVDKDLPPKYEDLFPDR
ncbi:hypothetical protein HHI36_007697 [Cryptolaemus montrouzieri]|uniref:Uncharacterized protein n=1 Tax=Cryptolaemus montrouzieri TaxID=559131 RepID=A0ABD2MQG8_9CUCU